MASWTEKPQIAVIGGGFCGLAAAYELGRRGARAIVLERDDDIGGLAGSFKAGGARLEKFYHHWFTNDAHIMGLIEELGESDQIITRAPPAPAPTTPINFSGSRPPATCWASRHCRSKTACGWEC